LRRADIVQKRPPDLTAHLTDDFDDRDLQGKVVRGVGWKVAGVGLGQATQSLVAILLAHLLAPDDFGLAGMAIAFSGIGAIIGDLALSAALIQRRSLSERDTSTIFWMHLVGGALWTALGVAVSPLVADFFNRREVAPLFAALSCSFFILSVGQVQVALLTRAMRFRTLEISRTVATVIGAAAAVMAALAGWGPWAIIVQTLCTYAASTVLMWTLSPWRPTWTFSRESFRSLGAFGAKTSLSRLLLYTNLNADNLLIGRYLGAASLGIYAVAYNVMMLPLSRAIMALRDVLYPALARLQDDPRRLGETWLGVNRVASGLIVPALLGLAAVAPDFVHVVLGQRWDPAIPVLQLLCLAGVADSFQGFNEDVYQARGHPGRFLRFMFMSTTFTVSAFVIGLHWGVVGVAASFAIARTIALLVNTTQLCRLIHLSPLRALRSAAEVTVVALVMAVVVFLTREILQTDTDIPAVARLVLCSLLGACVYLMVALTLSPSLPAEIRRTLAARHDVGLARSATARS
jgi:O-antigen/teichoic acid export membrane protein